MAGRLQWLVAALLTLVTSWLGHPATAEISKVTSPSPVSVDMWLSRQVTTLGLNVPFRNSQESVAGVQPDGMNKTIVYPVNTLRGFTFPAGAANSGMTVYPSNRLNLIWQDSIRSTLKQTKGATLSPKKPSSPHFYLQNYQVHSGDTLWSIAMHYKVSVRGLEEWNHLDSSLIRPNQILHIRKFQNRTTHVQVHPMGSMSGKGFFYTVLPGDTLWNIAISQGTSVQALMDTNHLLTSLIHPGEQLHIPVSTPSKRLSSRQGVAIAHGVPVNLLSAYESAGRRFGIPWTVLAAIHKVESDFCTANCPDSYAGAVGPMQFLPQTFAIYATSAPWHTGPTDIENVYDAIYTAAHMLAANGFARNPFAAIFAYNHSYRYVERVLSLARRF